ncbi:uncharacterized protein HD556DRAFT_1429513 [Suillus plorans]|uniref:Uncharacterized protein n=1 Tax=Suillus plorans TaxID=116603 RepID=A0A9P7DTL6_9AGAM|nr:uncharacterized protein HD556DRAFT_1429513 [Suillus plorans]KAG1802711.1 hypothetical protein HD556DRAFT_1429513 [Suillus plorans]
MSSGGKTRIQPLGRRHPRVRLSKEVRALLTASRHEKSQRFRAAINNVWAGIDESVKTISASNHKSIRRVQRELYMGQSLLRHKRLKLNTWNAFCWKKNQSVDKENGPSGKALLPELINTHRSEYHALSNNEKDSLLKEYEEHRTTKTNRLRISTKSKVNDVTQTIKAIENELNSLRCRTGAETILYTTRGSTDLPLRGIAFATEGVDDFMESVMNIDNQEFVTKMEGFALRGLCGDEIRHLINHKLQQITGNPKATMQWVHYWFIVEGWPDEIPFDNLSKAASGIPTLEDLKDQWKSRETAWRQLDDEEFQELVQERNSKLGSDKGKKQRRALSPIQNATSRPRKKAYTSPATVDSEGENDGTPVSSPNNDSTPVSSPNNDSTLVSSPNNLTLDTEPRNNAPVSQAGQPELTGTLFDSFVDSFPNFSYEEAITSLNRLLGGPAPTS